MPFQLVDKPEQFDNVMNSLSRSSVWALDLEFDRDRHFYGFTLCLIQIANEKGEIYLIDPMNGLDLQPLFHLLENDQILKIMHTPGEDIRLLHSLKCFPQNMFDTEVCAKLLNYPKVSLGSMVERFFDIILDKNQQTSAWHNRPLSDAQMSYAASDVRYLIPLYRKLMPLIEASPFKEYVLQEQELLNTEIHILQKKQSFLKKADIHNFSPLDCHILNGLLTYRDHLAEKRNRSPHFIFPDTAIRDLVHHKEDISFIFHGKGIPAYMKTGSWRNRWQRKINQYRLEAEELNLGGQTGTTNNNGKQDLHKIRYLKDTVFIPIQNEISSIIGENAIRYVFSTNTINDLLRKNILISGLKPVYRQQLVLDAGKKLGKDLSAFI